MNLCIDVGNSTIGVGIYDNDVLVKRFSISHGQISTIDEYYILFKKYFDNFDIDLKKITNTIYSSVVPNLDNVIVEAIKRLFNIEPFLIGPGCKTGLSIRVDNPLEIGNDLISDLVGAKEKYGYPCLIADLGTASKILLIDKNGTFTSCIIVPGLSVCARALVSKTALLPEINLVTPKTVLAKNTKDAMNAGVMYGHADMIVGLIKRYEQELNYSCKHVLTGGNGAIIANLLPDDFIFDENLNLDGLNLIIKKNCK